MNDMPSVRHRRCNWRKSDQTIRRVNARLTYVHCSMFSRKMSLKFVNCKIKSEIRKVKKVKDVPDAVFDAVCCQVIHLNIGPLNEKISQIFADASVL